LEDLDRHDLLPCELGQGGASERAWDIPDQLESPWLACRWMISKTALLNLCQARNDSGSLSPILTGSVTPCPDDPEALTQDGSWSLSLLPSRGPSRAVRCHAEKAEDARPALTAGQEEGRSEASPGLALHDANLS
jgi:hypothetical protein